MTAAPAISMKRLDDMSLDELHREFHYWDDYVNKSQSWAWGPSLGVAIDMRTGAAAMLSRRLRKIEGEESSLGKRLPDTNNLKEATA